MTTKSQIPSFGQSWTVQMEAFLLKEKEKRGEAFFGWAISQIPDICASWGDDSKLIRVAGVLRKVLGPEAVPMVASRIDEWSRRL